MARPTSLLLLSANFLSIFPTFLAESWHHPPLHPIRNSRHVVSVCLGTGRHFASLTTLIAGSLVAILHPLTLSSLSLKGTHARDFIVGFSHFFWHHSITDKAEAQNFKNFVKLSVKSSYIIGFS
jgi:hypothetical protein